MKKKLLPFILGCAMIAAMPIAVFAGDGDETHGSSTIQGNNNINLDNEKANYRSGNATTLTQDLTNAEATTNTFSDTSNDTAGTVDLETSVSEYTMEIPSDTILPIGTKRHRVGNVSINGSNFVKPDKIKVLITKQNFRHKTLYDTSKAESHNDNKNKVIPFTVTDKRYTTTNIAGTIGDENDKGTAKYFFQDGTIKDNGTSNDASIAAAASSPYAYTQYSSSKYQSGAISNINETHQVWVLTEANAWQGKLCGSYEGLMTFDASVVTDEPEGIYTASNLYPGEGSEQQP